MSRSCIHTYFTFTIGVIKINDRIYVALTDKTYATRSDASQSCQNLKGQGGHFHLVIFETAEEQAELQAYLRKIPGKGTANN